MSEVKLPAGGESRGAFIDSLYRNNKDIRRDRADAIGEDTQLVYKRAIEDLQLRLTRMKRAQQNILDLSPTDARSLVLAADFDSQEFTEKDMQLCIDIRNTEIELELAHARYKQLFGEG